MGGNIMVTARERIQQLKNRVEEKERGSVIVDKNGTLWDPMEINIKRKTVKLLRLGYENEANIIKEAYPQFKFDYDYENEDITLKGEFKTNKGNKYKLKVIYPYDYPCVHPEIYIEEAIINGKSYIKELEWGNQQPVHMNSKNHIDWGANTQTWDPEKSTGVDALTAAALWLFSYECYVFDGDNIFVGFDHEQK